MTHADTFEEPNVAIIGMSGRFPGAHDLEEFWRNLEAGVESIARFTDEELLAAGVSPELFRRSDYVPARGMLADVDLFDAAFFGFNPRDAELLDPQQRIFLECAWSALEDAGCDPERTRGPIGVFASGASNFYLLRNLLPNERLVQEVGSDQLRIANRLDNLATRISYKLNLRGPSLTVQTGCSSSLVAVHLACQSLLSGESYVALAGGIRVNRLEKSGYLHQEDSILSADGHCRAFDARASGTVSGDGIGVVVLKRLADALAEGDSIYAVIKGSAINNDGAGKIGYTAPSVDGQVAVIREALAMAAVEPATVSYVEAHGTGTALGDPIEIAALNKAFRSEVPRTGPCAIGSVKTNIGHLDTASGVAGLIKTTLALSRGCIPASLHFERPNPRIDLSSGAFVVNAELRPWPSDGAPRSGGVSSFGIGGTNAHVVVEEAPAPRPASSSRSWHLWVLSAKSASALAARAAHLADHLERQPAASAADVACTLQFGRKAFDHRSVLVCRSVAEGIEALRGGRLSAGIEPGAPSPVFLFPGQGSQYPGMAAELFETESVFRETVDRCCELLVPVLGKDLRPLLFPSAGLEAVAEEELRQTRTAQPALFVVEYALARLLARWGIEPQALAGHSVGEYTAACLAGVFRLEDALALVAARGRLMQEMPPGAMSSLPLSEEEVRPLLGDELDLAAVNAPSLCVVSGSVEAVAAWEAELAQRGLAARRLRTSHAFHSAMMDPAVEAFGREVEAVERRAPRVPLLSCMTGTWMTEEEARDPRYWGAQLRRTVRFSQLLSAALAQRHRALLEVGPGRALTSFARFHPLGSTARLIASCLPHPQDGSSAAASLLTTVGRLWLTGVDVDWSGLHDGEHRNRLHLPAYPFERQRYWIEPPAGASGADRTAGRLRKHADLAEWFYLPSWKRSLPPAVAAGAPPARALVLADDHGLGDRLVERMEREGFEVATASIGPDFSRLGPRRWSLRPGRQEDFDALLAALRDEDRKPGLILHLWSLTLPAAERSALDLGFYSLLAVARPLAASGEQEPVRLTVVGNGLQSVTGEEALRPEWATVLGAFRVLPQEHPHLTCQVLDLPFPGAGIAIEPWLERLVAEVTAPAAEPIVVYRSGYRWIPSFEPVRVAAAAMPGRLKPGGTYWILGGLGRIGLALAERLARELRANLVLTSRSDSPPRHRILEMEQGGARVAVLPADVADREQMERVLARIEEDLGELSGVIFAAGLTGSFRPVAELDRAACEAHFRSKVDGLHALDHVLQGRRLDFCLVLSSLSALLGGLGYAPHSAAHSFVDSFVQQRGRDSDTPWLSVNLDGWRFEQGAPSALSELAMTPEEWVEALWRVLGLEGIGQIVVSTGDLGERLRRYVTRTSADREASPAPAPPSTHARPALGIAYAAPEGETEQAIARIWQILLGVDRVGRDDDFFELGGHSLLAIQVISRLREAFRVELSMRDLFSAPTIAMLATQVERVKSASAATAISDIERVPRGGGLLLSFAQQRLWFLDQLQPGNPFYNEPGALHLRGRLSVDALARSLSEIVRRHEVLRTVFPVRDGQAVQEIRPAVPVPMWRVDLSDLPEEARQEELSRRISAEARRPFDLARGPLLRAGVVVLGPEDQVLLLTLHHIVSDGWSAGLLVRELVTLYGAYLQGFESPLPELAIQYADFAHWQRQWLSGEELERQLAYWRRQLAGAPPVLELPADRPRPALPSFRGRTERFTLARELGESLRGLGRGEGATLFMTLLAAFQVLLWRYSGQRDLSVGTPIAGRNRLETEKLIGFFVNALVLRVEVPGEWSFRDLLGRVREVSLEAHAHQDLPFERLVEELSPERSLAHTPLFQVWFTLQNVPHEKLALPGLEVSPLPIPGETSKFDLNLSMVEREEGLEGGLEHSTDLFDRVTVVRLLEHWWTLLGEIVSRPDARLSELSLLSEVEKRDLLVERNASRWPETPSGCVHEWIAAQAERRPEAVAVVFGPEELSYGELMDRAGRLARYLGSLGVGPGSRVGVLLEHSPETAVALLGVLESGAAYVPLDPAQPRRLTQSMLRDSGATVVLTQARLCERLPETGVRAVCLDTETGAMSRAASGRQVEVSAQWPAYVIYTSGSTGEPKGVEISHGSLSSYVGWAAAAYVRGEEASFALHSSLSFDLTVTSLYVPLVTGNALVVYRGEEGEPPILRVIGEDRVEVVKLTPSHLRLVAESGMKPVRLRRLIVGGEALTTELTRQIQSFLGPRVEILNEYGPTEATVGCMLYRYDPSRDQRTAVPIGLAGGGAQIYVLDENLEPVAESVTGELYVSGACVARGYVGRPSLTAERFVPDPFGELPGSRMYRTGDLARWLPDGSGIEYVGRRDEQVKYHGYRVELEGIRSQLNEHPQVRDSVVVLARDEAGREVLAAYYVSRQALDVGELRQFLAERVLEGSIPTVFVHLRRLPLTLNGKVNRSALPSIREVRNQERPSCIAPRNPVEELVAGIWSEILGVGRIGAEDDFFALGGHSLLATRVLSRVRSCFGVELAMRALFESPTVAGLSRSIERQMGMGGSSAPPIERVPREGDLPLSFAQQRLWFVHQLQPDSLAYHVPVAARFAGGLDAPALERALAAVLRRHEALRTRFEETDDGPVQVIAPDDPAMMRRCDLSAVPPEQREAELQRQLDAEVALPFDLTRGPLLRSTLFRLGDDEHVLLLVLHHIACDGWSMGVLLREVVEAYAALREGRPVELPELQVQYADYAVWQRRHLEGERLDAQLAYWQRHLAGAPVALRIPTDQPRPALQSYRGRVHRETLSATLAGALRDLGRREGATLFMALLAAAGALLRHWTGETDLVIGTDIANRNRLETERLIGFFVNQLALRIDLSGDPSFRELLGRVREVTLDAYLHQDAPFDQVVNALGVKRDPSRSPLFQVQLLLQNAPPPPRQVPGLALAPVALESRTSKLDLLFAFVEKDDGLQLAVEYDSDLFLSATIRGLSENLVTLLKRIVIDPEITMSALGAEIGAAERVRRRAEELAVENARANLLNAARRRRVGETV